jgi:tetratricopeptide (TPR) repeat protein
MNPQLQRGLLLFQQGRHPLAETEFRQALAQDPDDAHAHALLALCLCHQEKFDPAMQEAQQAIHLAPDFAFAHYALAWVLDERRRYGEALGVLKEAIRLEPQEPDYRALEAQINLNLRQWQPALAAAEAGLQFDPDHVGCTNLRAMALVKLGRKSEAGAALDTALARNPDDAASHANRGWSYLEQSDPRKALEHFQEALRLDPENEWARGGLVEALKARYLIYSLMLKWFLWMSKLSSTAQWGVIIGGYFLMRLLGRTANENPALAPWLLPVQVLYFGFVVLTWTAGPLFNLLLRVNRFGRLVLSAEERTASNWFGLCAALALAALLLGLVGVWSDAMFQAALVFGLLLLPVSAVFRCAKGWPRTAMALLTLGIAGLGLAGASLTFVAAAAEHPGDFQRAAMGLTGLFLLSVFLSQFIANLLMSRQPTR